MAVHAIKLRKTTIVLDNYQRVDDVLAGFAKGEIVVVTDDDDRENEGDLFVAASLCTPEKMAFIIRNTSGIVCAPLDAEQAKRLHLDPMVAANDAPLGTAFTITVDVRHGLTTGISAEERNNTVRALANGNSGAADFVRPGHVFPLVAKDGGVLMRSGHTEACVDLCRLAGLPPVGVLSELMNDDGTVMRGPTITAFAERHKLKQISIADLIAYRQARDKLVKRIGEFPVQSQIGTLTGYAYVTPFDAIQHMAFVYGRIGDGKNVLARLHRADIIRDVFGGANPVHASLQRFKQEERGVLIFLRDGAAGVPTHAIPQSSFDLLGGCPLAQLARGRAGRADSQGSRHFLDPALDLAQAQLCGACRFRDRDRGDGAVGAVTAMLRKLPAVLTLFALAACDSGVKSTCTTDCITVYGEGPLINGSGSSKTEVRPVAAFSAIRLSDVGARVVIDRTGKESLEVTADDNLVALFTSEVKDGTLYLSAAKGKSMSGKQPLFKVTVSKLRQLGVSGSGSVDAAGLDGEALAMSIAGSGEITVAGWIDDVTVSISGSGTCNAAGLKAKRAKAAVRGSGELTVNASDELDANVIGSGTIMYIGSPKVTSNISGSGAIEQKQIPVRRR